MDATSFGSRLRHERQTRGVSLQELSAATRISVRSLEALETERWERLPGGVFNRGFLRTIARHLSIDERALVADYASATNDPPQLLVLATAAPAPARRSHLWLVGAAAMLVVLLCLVIWLV